MGKRLFQEVYVSQSRTDELGLPGLIVVSEADDRDTVDFTYHAVHKSYFDKDKMTISIVGPVSMFDSLKPFTVIPLDSLEFR